MIQFDIVKWAEDFVKATYPVNSKGYPDWEANLDELNNDVDEIAKAIKRRYLENKLKATKNFVRNITKWLENNKATLSKEQFDDAKKKLEEANKWLEDYF